MQRRFIIEKFGKIERAEIQVSPLTLFVGDNNSGKSYLLSLLWAIYSAEDTSAIFHNFTQLQIKKKQEVYDQLCKFVLNYHSLPKSPFYAIYQTHYIIKSTIFPCFCPHRTKTRESF